MELNTIFFNQAGRLRSGWRFAVYFFVFVFTNVLVGGVLSAIDGVRHPGEVSRLSFSLILTYLVLLALVLVIAWFCQKYLEDLPFKVSGAAFTHGWLRNLIAGLVLGAVSISLAILVAMAFGGISLRLNSESAGTAVASTLLASLAIFIAAAAFEEALFRGYMFQTFIRSGLGWFGVLVTSLMFATVHNSNPSASLLSWLNTFIAGVWFGIAYLKTRDLWFPFGLHLMWNWMQGAIFGVEVSGLTEIVSAPLFKEADAGPAWLTGTTYGIEGGIAATIALVAATVATHFLPGLKPSDEMLAMTSTENPIRSVS